MIEQLLKKEKKIALVGLGYVGLPIALEFAKHVSVIGFDINEKRVEMMCATDKTQVANLKLRHSKAAIFILPVI